MTTFEAAPRAATTTLSRDSEETSRSSSLKTGHHGYAAPHKGFFSPTPTRSTTAVNSDGHVPTQQQPTQNVDKFDSPSTMSGADASSLSKSRSSRPRRESIGQMRRKASDSATAAASAGGIGMTFANPRAGQPIPASRSVSRGFSTSPRVGAGDGATPSSFSASLGSAAEALSLPASVLNSGSKSGRPTGHTHFGQECYGPEPGESIPNPPSSLTKNSSATTTGGLAASAPNGASMERRGSIAESIGGDDDASSVKNGGKELPIHRCESCNKVYRHPSCLVKHRWEHTVYWKEASKFLMSKHQQVQLLEAAAILVNMDGDAASLPDEKALWPAAVSPASSGLLGSDRVNFDRMMSRKAALRGRASSIAASSVNGDTGDTEAGSVPRSASGGLSPLNSFSKLGLNGLSSSSRTYGPSSYNNAYSYGSLGAHRLNSDIQHLVLDESDERTTATTETEASSDDRTDSRDRSGSAETTEDDESAEAEMDPDSKGKWGLHEDAVADMDMEE